MRNWKKLINPKISIVICNYNYENYISKTIESVLNQTYPAWEIIVVDDGSTDASVSVINQYIENKQIELVQKSNGGQVSAYNLSMSYITGDVVIFLDSDDELLKDALQDISTAFNDDVVKVHYKMNVIDQDGRQLGVVLPKFLDQGNCGKKLVSHGLLYKSPPASGNAFRVSALRQLFPLPTLPNEKHSADFFCIYGIALLGEVFTVSKALFNYRVHNKGKSENFGFGNALTNYDIEKAAETRWAVFKSWVEHLNLLDKHLPLYFLDFNQQKLFYSLALVKADTVSQKYKVFRKYISKILKAIYFRDDLHFANKIILSNWALLIWIMPKPISHYLIKKICNPSGQ